jgi:uncharacterized protein (TIGR00251 family)
MKPAAEPVADGVRVFVRATPNASQNSLGEVTEGPGQRLMIRVSVTAPPENGKANQAIIVLLAKTWRVPKQDITLISGETSRHKAFHIRGVASPAALGF